MPAAAPVKLRRLAARFDPTMKRVRLDRTVLEQAWRNMDRRTSNYRPALILSGMLMDGKGLSLEGGGGRLELPGFLFDMNAFFQALISRLLRDHLDDAEILDEHRLHQVFYYDPAHNPLNRRGPVPRPDFVVRREHRTVAIDAKYRDLWESALPREMLYQLAVYALSQSANAPSAVILYPTLARGSREQVVVFQDVLHARTKARVILRPANLLVLAELLRAGPSPHAKRGLRALVQGLVGGEAATAQLLRAA